MHISRTHFVLFLLLVSSPLAWAAGDDLVINEIMYHRYSELLDAEGLGAEYIELFNRGNTAVNLTGWYLDDGIAFAFPDVSLAAHGYLVVAADPEGFGALYPGVTDVVGPWAGRLSNAGEKIALYDASEALVDEVRYADSGDWGVRELGPEDSGHRGWAWRNDHDGGGHSLELANPALPNEYGANWAASSEIGGTPGRSNSVQANDVAPLIADVTHSPEVPGSLDPVTVTARVIDERPNGLTVRLRYRPDRSVYTQAEIYPEHDVNDYTALTMFDDGQHHDGSPNDGVYGAVIPAQSDRVVVEFYVEAVDSGGQTRTWPGPSWVDDQWRQVTNALYQVEDAFNPYTYWTVGAQPLYYMIMTEAERARLARIGNSSQDSYSRAQMNATFISVHGDGLRCRYNVGVRNRGNSSQRVPPNNYHVNFPTDRKWKNRSAININSKYTFNQVLGSALFHRAGLLVPDATRVQVRVNGQDLARTDPQRMYGAYVHVEAYDGDWAQSHLPDDSQANIYSCVSRGRYCNLEYRGEDPKSYSRPDYYAKTTNETANDWSDLIQLTYALDVSPDQTYLSDVEAIVNVDQWCRWFALEALLVNRETNLSSGYADDYFICSGTRDPRFLLLPHDLDTILNASDPKISIWLAGRLDSLPAVKRFLTHPEVAPRYFAQLKDLAETVFAPERFDPLVDQLLGDWIPQQDVDRIKAFAANRRAYVLSVIPTTLTVDSALYFGNDYHAASAPTVTGDDVRGTADAIRTRSVLVNGQPAQWSPWTGTWSLGPAEIGLMPGVNRLTIEAFEGPAGQGRRIDSGHIDILYDHTAVTSLSGTIFDDMVLDAASGPWYVSGTVVVPAGVTLRIEPGTTLFFRSDVGLEVREGGRLLAEGAPYAHIRFTHLPGMTSPWQGVMFDHTLQDNRLVYVDIDHANDRNASTDVRYSRVLFDHVTWGGTDTTVLALEHPTVTARDCVFPSIGGVAVVRGSGLTGDEGLIFERCTFGPAAGDNDVLDFSGGKRPGPILQVYDSLFLGGHGYGLNLNGADAYIEGSTFTDFRRDPNTGNTSSAISGAPYGGEVVELSVVRNVFAGNDRAVQLKAGSFLDAQNNTFVDGSAAAVSFGDPPDAPARGLWATGNVFWDNTAVFEHFFDDTQPNYGPEQVLVDNSLLPSQWHDLGRDNIDADPLFVTAQDFHLRDASAARQMGPWGLDMGAYVLPGAAISGGPYIVTHRAGALLTVGGPGITHYAYSVNDPDGPWSDERPVGVPIELAGLRDGDVYTVYVLGRNSAGRRQDQPNASRTWTVDITSSRLVINEILAINKTTYEHEGTYPDLIELFYDGPSPVDLSDMTLSDDENEPDKFIFPEGTRMDPGDYLVLLADSDTGTSGLHLGFSLNSQGEQVVLYDRHGQLIDSVTFGNQLSDVSIGRTYDEGRWRLTVPAFGQANVAYPLGDLRSVRINEWLAAGEVLYAHDFIELYNAHTWPVDIGGAFLTDNPTTQPAKHEIRPLSFMAGRGFVVFKANNEDVPGHVDFSLSLDGETIGLFAPDLTEIDRVIYGPQTPEVSQGRFEDGSSELDYSVFPTPGLSNQRLPETATFLSPLVLEEASKRVMVPLGPNQVADDWNSNPAFDDSDWLSVSGAPGGVGYERALSYESAIGLDVGGQMYGVNATCYVRVPFQVSPNGVESLTGLYLSVRYDDGFVAYLNGTEVARANFSGTPRWDSQADTSHEALVDVFDLVLDISDHVAALAEGDNLLAIHALNGSATSSDFLISAALDGIVAETPEGDFPYAQQRALLDGLRITELMYHSPAGNNLDYIELQNVSDVTLDLTALRFTDGIEFTFGPMMLGPGEYAVVVDDIAAFQVSYGDTIPVAGQYEGRLDNGGEAVVLQLASPFEAAVMRFVYQDQWYPATDGDGQSLTIRDVTAAPVTWNDPANWRSSTPTPGGP